MSNPDANAFAQRPLYSFVKKRRCAKCYGHVRDVQNDDGSWSLVCPRGCHPPGHVSEDFVEMQRTKDINDYAKVAANYPDLAPATVESDPKDSLF